MLPGPEATVVVGGTDIQLASPVRLSRKTGQAAVFEFRVPRRAYRDMTGNEESMRQGMIVELYVGSGGRPHREFYGRLLPTASDTPLGDRENMVRLRAYDLLGILADTDVVLTRRDDVAASKTDSSFLDVVGLEVGQAVAEVAQRAIDAMRSPGDFNVLGVLGTNSPRTMLTLDNAKSGAGTAKAACDSFVDLPRDDTNYPDLPLFHEYFARGPTLVMRKQRALTARPDMRIQIGVDAVLAGTNRRQQVVSAAVVRTAPGTQWWRHLDRDAARRWGGAAVFASAQSSGSFLGDAYDDAVRLVELGKREQRSLVLELADDPLLPKPGDVVSVWGGEARGVQEAGYRASEVHVSFDPVMRARLTLGEAEKVLTDFL